jgi:uncharacterized protein
MLGLALATLVALASDVATPPPPTRWAEDHVGFLTPAVRDQLDRSLEAYERATGHQVIVWIGDSIGSADLADWAVRTFASWKVGRKGIDDGIVMFVLAGDRTVDIEVGYGLEGQVPDAIASRIIREVITPRLRADDHDGAITAGVDALLAAIEGKPWDGAIAPSRSPPPSRQRSPVEVVLYVLAGIALLIFAITHPRTAMLLLWSIARSGGGGFGGGGGGGFGGGGGRSGGGGARGSW